MNNQSPHFFFFTLRCLKIHLFLSLFPFYYYLSHSYGIRIRIYLLKCKFMEKEINLFQNNFLCFYVNGTQKSKIDTKEIRDAFFEITLTLLNNCLSGRTGEKWKYISTSKKTFSLSFIIKIYDIFKCFGRLDKFNSIYMESVVAINIYTNKII